MSLTKLCHKIIKEQLTKLTYSIDATCGNGYDTQFLLQNTQAGGIVFAFDVQQKAIQSTLKTCASELNLPLLNLFKDSHENLTKRVPFELHKKIDLIMFNLGYLPKSLNRSLCTKTASTLSAIQQCCHILKPGGYLTILAYPGHPKGYIETKAVQEWILMNQNLFDVSHYEGVKKNCSPQLWFIKFK